jgi:poly(A) polymerase
MYLPVMPDLKPVLKPRVFSLLTRVSGLLTEQGIAAYLIGGLVRDMLLERNTADIDIAVAADALKVAPKLAGALGGKYVLLDGVNRIGRVVLAPGEGVEWEIDLATIEGDITQDLGRRDFTIDAMALDFEEFIREPEYPALIDPFHGEKDLRRGMIRAVDESAFPSDPLRLLRAVRLAAELGFHVEPETEAMMRHYAHLITGVARERIREELLGILSPPGCGQRLAYLDELGLLAALFPELTSTRGVEQPKEHFWDVFQHSIRTVEAVEFLLRQVDWEYAGASELTEVPWSGELKQHFDGEVSHGSTRKAMLKLAALLHDVAKPQTKTVEASGRTRFLGHAQEGAAIAGDILARLRFSTREIKLVEVMIRHHLRPTQLSHQGLPSRRAIYRYFRDAGEAGVDILFLSLADHLASRGPHLDTQHWREHARMTTYVLAQHFSEATATAPPKLIDGHDLMERFALSPGPVLGEILEAVREMQAAGEITSRDEALAYIEVFLSSSGMPGRRPQRRR